MAASTPPEVNEPCAPRLASTLQLALFQRFVSKMDVQAGDEAAAVGPWNTKRAESAEKVFCTAMLNCDAAGSIRAPLRAASASMTVP